MSSLHNTLLGDLVFSKKELLHLDVDLTIGDALQYLKDHDILAAPVFNGKNCQYVGMVDTWDIMTTFALCRYCEDLIENPDADNLQDAHIFNQYKIKDLLEELPSTKKLYVFEPTDSLGFIMKPMEKGLNSCLVRQIDDHTRKNCYRMITRTDVIKHLMDHENEFGKTFNMAIDELGFAFQAGKKDSLVIGRDNEVALLLYQRMFSFGVTAMPIVNKEGMLVTTLSPSDLKGMTKDKLHTLMLPVTTFLRVMSGKCPAKPVTCGTKTRLRDVAMSALTAKVHRVWAVNSAQEPLGVVSFSDIIGAILQDQRR